MTPIKRSTASFRDPSGFIFEQDGQIYRQINQSYQSHYDQLISSGLYAYLVQHKQLVAHQEMQAIPPVDEQAYRVIRPETIDFISYPYEWCFSQLKDAALLTLATQKAALDHGMTLMDASAYNIQFLRGKPIFIDTLSFEIRQEGQPWTAYQQFCQYFLAPLALMAFCDVRLSQLLRVHIDGIPLDLTSRLLPARTRLNFGLFTHIHLHASAQKQYADKDLPEQVSQRQISRNAHLGLLESLETCVRGLKWKPGDSEWANYYTATNYSQAAFVAKAELVKKYLQRIPPAPVLDLGANSGLFSRVAADLGLQVVSADIDPGAVEFNYQESVRKNEERLLPLLIDLTNPSAGLGWNNLERAAFFQRRQPGGTILALALVHHLAISNNLPLDLLAEFFSAHARWLIIEFVPKQDSQVQRLLKNRRDIFQNYHVDGFEAAFLQHFTLRDRQAVPESERWIYLFERI